MQIDPNRNWRLNLISDVHEKSFDPKSTDSWRKKKKKLPRTIVYDCSRYIFFIIIIFFYYYHDDHR